MNKVALITSIDYELFGDGTGNVTREQINTTNYLKHLAEVNNVKLSIMFEYAQYIAYEKYEKFSDDNKKIREQLIDLIQSGHDVQLHYHAQWHNAKYNDCENIFELNLSNVDISSLKYEEIVHVLSEGKQFLENLLQPYKEDYQCVAFRAGSWAVEDENKLVKALIQTGFKIDTSVVPNVTFNEGYIKFSYPNCPHRYHYWYINKKLSEASLDRQLMEIPIYTIKNKLSIFKYINMKSIVLKLLIHKLYKQNISRQKMSIKDKIISKLFRNYYMADINSMKYTTLFNMIENVIEDKEFENEEIVPIMFVGHSKASYNMDDMYLLYNMLLDKYGNHIEYWTLQDVYKNIMDR